MHQPLLPYSPHRDVYRLLGVPSNASTDEITLACRRLARTFHPDRNGSNRANAEMQVVNAVRRVLSDPELRAVYDRERLRFHTVGAHPIPPGELRESPIVAAPPRDPGFGRYLRAAILGARAAVEVLLPPRCRTCRIVISGEDSYCAACGTPLLSGGSPAR
jgi:curved DNA-binding protein CbpA